jgi:hypothetical protein
MLKPPAQAQLVLIQYNDKLPGAKRSSAASERGKTTPRLYPSATTRILYHELYGSQRIWGQYHPLSHSIVVLVVEIELARGAHPSLA